MNKRLLIPHDRVPTLRGRAATRRLLESGAITPSQLVMPLLVNEAAADVKTVIPSLTLSQLPAEVKSLSELGIRGVKLFTASSRRSQSAQDAINKDNLMGCAIDSIKNASPIMCVMTEACLCPYTSDGACVVRGRNGKTDLVKSCNLIAQSAVLQANRGADIIGPAAMLPMSVRNTRDALNSEGHYDVSIMPHIIVQSTLYTLYRRTMGTEADHNLKGALQIQSNYANQCVDFASQTIEEGADMLLMEPALFILDILSKVRQSFRCPIAAFSVSGEYQMVTSAGHVDRDYARTILLEFVAAVRRAGADMIVTYAAKEIATFLQSE